ncbi:MAG: Fic family protein [Phycisphaeraceae bacterium]|nr:MAG: Fic family protein [Phycisphaeraceae bacterium]
MNPNDFHSGFPGDLESTKFEEIGRDGKPLPRVGMAFVPRSLPPALDWNSITGRLFPLLDQVRRSLTQLDGEVDSLPSTSILLGAMTNREAQASSRIENTVSSLHDLVVAEIDESRVPADSLEVLRNRRAIEHGVRSNLPVCSRLLREMHQVLIADPRQRPGEFRDRQVYIGNTTDGFDHARFVPPPPARVDECMARWESFCNPPASSAPDRPRLAYFIELALAHYQFEAIHPFSDGNGRLGRALVTLAPVKDGELRHPVCNLSEWVQSNRQEYYDRLLRVSTHGEWEAWIGFFCRAIVGQSNADLLRAGRLKRMYEDINQKIKSGRRSTTSLRLVDALFERPALSIPIAQKVLGVTYRTAAIHVQDLVKAGFLVARDNEVYNKVFIAPGVLDAIRGSGED